MLETELSKLCSYVIIIICRLHVTVCKLSRRIIYVRTACVSMIDVVFTNVMLVEITDHDYLHGAKTQEGDLD